MTKKHKKRKSPPGWRVLKTRQIFTGKWFELRQDHLVLPEGKEVDYTFVEHPGSVFVVPFTSNNHVVLIRSYRHTIGEWCWEVPAGTLADQPGKQPRRVAERELAEEIGGKAQRLEKLGWYYMSNGFARCRAHIFAAYGVTVGKPTLGIAEEVRKVQSFPISDIFKMIKGGKIRDGDSAFALLLTLA